MTNESGRINSTSAGSDFKSRLLFRVFRRPDILCCVFIFWVCFLLRGLFYCSVVPLWEGFDEWAHFAVVNNMASTGHALIDRNILVSKEINTSLQLAPLPRGMTLILPPGMTREAYWQLSPGERIRREQILRGLPVEWANETAEGGMPAYEASQPPLYYWILALISSSFRNLPLLDRVWILRIVTFMIGSLTIPLGFLIIRRLFQDDAVAVGVTALVAVMPELSINLSRVSNESLSIVLYTSLFLAVLHWANRPESFARAIAVGLLLGFGLLTKAYFLTALPAFLVYSLWLCWHEPQKGRLYLKRATIALIVALGIAGWWYARNVVQTGTLSGLDEAVMLRRVGIAEKLSGFVRVQWTRALATVLLSHIWYGGWSLLALPRSVYYLSFAFVIVGFCGLLKGRKIVGSRKWFGLASFYTWFWLGQMYQIVMLFLSKASSTAMGGWYLYSVVWAEMALWTIGLFSLVPARLHAFTLTVLIALMAALDIAAIHLVSIPYYAHADDLLDLHIAGLLSNKPRFLTGNVLFFMWIAYIAGTLLVVVTGARVLLARKHEPAESIKMTRC